MAYDRPSVSISYTPEKTAKLFHMDPSYIRAIRGPVGGGKTVALCMEILRLALEQQPDVNEYFYPRLEGRAVRPSRWLAVRATYPQLKATFIRTFMEWMGKLGTIVYDSPIRWRALIPLPDNTVADVEVVFMALDDKRSEENLRSLEVTGVAISEYSEISEGVLTVAKSRTGRYPKVHSVPATDPEGKQIYLENGDKATKVVFGATRPCIIMESNSPSTRSHWYRIFEVDRPPGHRIFAQPPALLYDPETETYQPNPEAENIHNLKKGYEYYFDIVNGSPPDYVNVFVLNQYGATFDGKPVFPAFNPAKHMLGGLNPPPFEGGSDPWTPERKRLIIGMDFGLNPAAVIGQDGALGQLTLYDELVGEGLLFETFMDDMLVPLLNTRFRGHPVLVVGDPAGDSKSALSRTNAYQMLRQRGIAVMQAPTNDISFRLESVNYFLSREGMLKVHPRCSLLREGFAGGYCFAEVRGKNGVFKETPDKGPMSHPQDAVQYICSYLYYGIRRATNMRHGSMTASSKEPPKKGYTYV